MEKENCASCPFVFPSAKKLQQDGFQFMLTLYVLQSDSSCLFLFFNTQTQHVLYRSLTHIVAVVQGWWCCLTGPLVFWFNIESETSLAISCIAS